MGKCYVMGAWVGPDLLISMIYGGEGSAPPNPPLFSICQQSHEVKVGRPHLPISFQLIELWYPGNLGRKGELALGR